MSSTQPNGLLHGIRIIDLTRVLAGPFCTMMLGDLGADIIKVEMPGRGDDTRHWGPPFAESGQSAYFLSANRNKRSLTLNLKSQKGQEILRSLIREGDVLVENFRTGTLEKWGLDYETLQAIRPGLIYCTITGYGYTGPYKDRPGYDFMVQAMGGFMSVTGPADGDPTRAGVAIADLATGMFASNAILASLLARERTGDGQRNVGQRIDMSLLDSQIALMSYAASNYLVSGEKPGRFGNGHPNIVPYQEFQARDQQFAFAAGNDNQWGKFCTAVNRTSWITDARFVTNSDRLANREVLIGMLNELFATRDAADWMQLCNDIGIPAAPINSLDQVFENPQVKAREIQTEVEHPTAGTIPLVASPQRVTTNPPQVRYAPPLLGEHTDELLQSMLGFDAEKIANLREEGVI